MTTATDAVEFLKGHGTGNDFVIIPDPDGELELSASQVARICDRRFGIGADGVIRVVRASASDEVRHLADLADWFMDYRNADGSIASMCGNGSRVFAAHLLEVGAVTGEFTIATRAGLHRCVEESDGSISVDMGLPAEGPDGPDPTVELGALSWRADAWWMPNPHAVVFVEDLDRLGSIDAASVISGQQRFPAGQNIEFVVDNTTAGGQGAPLRAQMRVLERGVGETLSCGTGACAVALSVRKRHEITTPGTVVVDVPGGTLRITEQANGRVILNGPATIVARGKFDQTWWEEIA